LADFNGCWIKWRVVYRLPLVAGVYEVHDEQNTRYYIGTRPGEPALYAVSLSRIEALIDRDPDIDEVVGSKIEDFKQSPVQNRDPRCGSNQRRSNCRLGFCFRKNSVIEDERLVSALEFRDFGTLTWAIFSKGRGRS
jgi:hypothetical protein